MKMAIGSVMILLFILSAGVTSGLANTKEQFCATYADKAVAQYNQGKQHNLPGIVPPAWSNDRNGHYNWCMMAPENIVNSEDAKRQAYLDKNITKTAPANQVVTGVTVGQMTKVLDMGKIADMAIAQRNQSYMGCFKDLKNRDLTGFSFHAPNMTKELCMTTCQQKGFQYAGLQYSSYCFCGDSYGKSGEANNCNMPCAGNKSEICGGDWANSLYRVQAAKTVAGAIYNKRLTPKMEKMTDRPGKDYTNFIITQTEFGVNQCLQACKNDIRCKAFTYVEISDIKAHCYLKNGIPSPVKKKNCTSGIVRPNNKTDYCNNYATDAIRSSNINRTNDCNYPGNRWSSNYQSHFSFCMKAPFERSQQEIFEREKLLKKCGQSTISGDLAAYDMCYQVNKDDGKISFYPIIKNVGTHPWKSAKKVQYGIHVQYGTISTEKLYHIGPFPSWKLNAGETQELSGISIPFNSNTLYHVSWQIWHDDDTNQS
ncbi:MAG TPA: hypothetical protein ENJ30_04505, partial [Desulfobulbaceae bacterium]|nr:hypothetical protein [Desulfobulbaceae bacterium]